jgi:hypothetical protein
MDRLGIARADRSQRVSASSVAEIFVDDAGERAIYMAAAATPRRRLRTCARTRRSCARAARHHRGVAAAARGAHARARARAHATARATVVDLDLPPSDALASGSATRRRSTQCCAGRICSSPRRAHVASSCRAGSDPLALARRCARASATARSSSPTARAGCAIAADGFEGLRARAPVKAIDSDWRRRRVPGRLLAALAADLGWEDAARLANACGARVRRAARAFPEDPDRARARARARIRSRCARAARRRRPERRAFVREALASFGVASKSSTSCAAGSIPGLSVARARCSRARASAPAACT